MKQIGVIGTGNMGSAIVRGLLDSGFIRASELAISDKSEQAMRRITKDWPAVEAYGSPAELCADCGVIILAVKPYMLTDLLDECAENLTDRAVISIAAGWTVAMLREKLEPYDARWLRVMPNTPALVGEGMTAICEDSNFSVNELEYARGIFDSLGKTALLPERVFDGVIAVSGSSPAYVYMMIEAMADAAVQEGIPRQTAIRMAAQSVFGSALMVLNSDQHPAALKDAVCSPGGTTIAAVTELERCGFRSAVQQAMKACADKSREMSR